MWTWSLNWGEVRDDLVIGSCPMTAEDLERIREGSGASALLSVQSAECHAHLRIDVDDLLRHAVRARLVLVNVPMRDLDPPDQRRRLPDAVRALHRLLAGGHRTYVHCTAGINRSPLTVLGYLTFVEGMAVDEAMRLIRAGRPAAEPYLEAYESCRQDLLQGCREGIALRAYELAEAAPGTSPEENWYQAEKDVLRGLFLARSFTAVRHLDPARG